VNHVQSIHSINFGLFILLHQLASSSDMWTRQNG